MATIKDIARAAGVSHGTASNVLNKRDGVSYEKIRLVEQTAVRMGYAIDEKASLLRRGKTRTIAVILPDITHRRYADLYTGIVHHAMRRAYDLRLFLTGDLPYVELNVIKDIVSLKVCGLLTVSCLESHREEYDAILSRKIPLLFLERAPEDQELPVYSFNMKEAAKLAFVQLNKPEQACILTSEACFSDQANFRAQIPLPADAFFENVPAGHTGAINRLVSRPFAPKGVICASEDLADKLLNAWHLSREGSMQIVALGSLRPIDNPNYQTIKLNYMLMGHEAVLGLIAKVEEGSALTSKVFPVSGVSGSPQKTYVKCGKTIRVLAHSTPSTLALEQLLPRFTRATGIEVEMLNCTLDDLYRRINSADIKTWDVLRLDPSMLPYLASRLLRPLESIDPSARDNSNRFIQGLKQDYISVEGTEYALPFDVSVQMLFYQRSLLEDTGQDRAFFEQYQTHLQVPATFDEYDRICRFFTRAYRPEAPSKYGSNFPPLNPTSIASDYLPRLLAADGLIYDSSGRLDMRTQAAQDSFRNYVKAAAYAMRQQMHSWSENAASFVKGDAATSILYVHHAANFVLAQRANAGVDIGFAPIPGGRPLLAGGSLGIAIGSEKAEEAYRFIVWATGENIAPELVMLGGISACRNVYEHRQILDTYPWLEVLPELISRGIRKPILSSANIDYNQRDFEYALGYHLLQAIYGTQTTQEALSSVQHVLDNITI